MAKFIQRMTRESLYDGVFDNNGWAAAGMGDVIVTENGKLIVIDGGFWQEAPDLLALLKKHCPAEPITVEHWIITHPHGDHYGALQEISRDPELRKQIAVKKIWYRFPLDFCGPNGQENMLTGINLEMRELCAAMGAEACIPEREDRFVLEDVTIRFLYVPDDCSILNTGGGNANMCSLIFTVSGSRKKVMVTGDAYGRSMQVTAWRYADELKCDILQMPHHALCDAYCVDFYRFIDPQVLLMPISVAGYRAMHGKLYEKQEGCIANLCLEAKASKVYQAFKGDVVLDI